jgi:hypothetical protein
VAGHQVRDGLRDFAAQIQQAQARSSEVAGNKINNIRFYRVNYTEMEG